MSDIVSYSPLKIIDDWLICPAACRGEQIVGGSKGVCPLGRRARVHAPPEKGRQGVRTKFGRPLEGGTRSSSPSKLTGCRDI